MRTVIFFICVVLLFAAGFSLGGQYTSKRKDEIKKELIGKDTKLAYRINHACGKGWEMFDWAVSADDIIIDCYYKREDGSNNWYTTKSVTIRR